MSSTVLRLRPPCDVPATLARYGRFGADAANRVETASDGGALLVRCVLDGHGGHLACRLSAQAGAVAVESDRPLDEVGRDAIRRLLGDDWDMEALARLAADDDFVSKLPLLRPPLTVEPFEALVTSITAQQVSLFAATGIRSRLIERYGRQVAFARAFPTPDELAAASPDDLRALGFSQRKAEYVTGLAALVATGALDLAALAALSDEEVVAELTAVRGLGVWTAEWFLLRTLGRPDVLPAGDLGVRKAVAWAVGEDILPAPEARRVGARWAPLRGLVVLQLLHALYVAQAPAAKRRSEGAKPHRRAKKQD